MITIYLQILSTYLCKNPNFKRFFEHVMGALKAPLCPSGTHKFLWGALFSRWVTLNKNCRWLLKSVSESVFNALSDGTFHFTLHGSLQNQQSRELWLASDWLYYFHQSGDGYLSCHRKQNGWYHLKEHWKLRCQKSHTIIFCWRSSI